MKKKTSTSATPSQPAPPASPSTQPSTNTLNSYIQAVDLTDLIKDRKELDEAEKHLCEMEKNHLTSSSDYAVAVLVYNRKLKKLREDWNSVNAESRRLTVIASQS